MRDGNPSCPYAGADTPYTAFIYNMRHIYITGFCVLKQYVSGNLGLCCCTLYSGVGLESCPLILFISQKCLVIMGEGNLRPLLAGAL